MDRLGVAFGADALYTIQYTMGIRKKWCGGPDRCRTMRQHADAAPTLNAGGEQFTLAKQVAAAALSRIVVALRLLMDSMR